MDLPIIDAHHHFWDLSLNKHPWLCDAEMIPFRYGDYSTIRKNFLVKDYQQLAAHQNVVKTVHVEAEWESTDPVGETRWLHALYDETGSPHALVGQVWFDRDDVATVLAGHASYPLTRSVRQKPKSSPTFEAFTPGLRGSLADARFREGYRLLKKFGLHYDLQTPWWHLTEAAQLAQDFPDTLIILNHSGLPADRSVSGLARWREAMEIFAEQPNTAVKISGICVPQETWTPALNREVVLETLRIFGVARCMFASNFPVDSLWASYDEIFGGFKAITSHFNEREQRLLFHDNALNYYSPV